MIWFVDEYLQSFLSDAKLCPGVDLSVDFQGDYRSEDISISIFWHRPCINLGWYPICQIDFGHKTIFHRDGSENSEYWDDLLKEAREFLSNYKPDNSHIVKT